MNIIGLYSKQSLFTGFPQYYEKSKGIKITSNNILYKDWSSMSVGCNLLGYNNYFVNSKAISRIKKGTNSSLVCEDEQTLAKMIIDDTKLESVRYTRTGGEALKIALDLAIKKTGSDEIVTCGYHGHHIKNMKLRSVDFNDHNALWSYRPKIFIFEPIRNYFPTQKWIETLHTLKKVHNCVIIADEVTSGYRFKYGPYSDCYDLDIDLMVLGKGISNGFPISVLAGKNEFMEQDYFISSTYFTDGLSCAAAIETLKILRKRDYSYLTALGQAVKTLYTIIQKHFNIPLTMNDTNNIVDVNLVDPRMKAGMTHILKEKGILHNGLFYPSFVHSPKDFTEFERKLKETFYILTKLDLNKFNPIQERPVKIK